MILNILNFLPKIDAQSLSELTHIIEQSKHFRNFNNNVFSDNVFELRYANYLGTKDPEFVEYYKQIVTEACYAEFLEWYEYLIKHILRKDVQQALGINFDHTSNNWVLEVQKSKVFGWAYQNKDIKIFLKNIYNVKELGDIMVKFFNERKPLSTLDEDYFESDHAQLVLDSIDKILIKNDRQELENQLQSDKVICMIEVYGWENRFNPILLDWIFRNSERIKQWI